MATKTMRNLECAPNLESEGVLLKPLDLPGVAEGLSWYTNLSPYDRLHCHHTLASVRRYAFFRPHKGYIPKDDLDFVLASTYQHGEEMFPDKIDTILQPDTTGAASWRVLRNYVTVHMGTTNARSVTEYFGIEEDREKSICKDIRKVYKRPYNKHHPVRIGGVMWRRHPSNIKLMNSSHHSPQTNAGYTRKEGDGNVFEY